MSRRARTRLAGWLRLSAAVLLCFATPATMQVLDDVVAVVTGVDCCATGCGDEGALPFQDNCAHCSCCVHPNVLAPTRSALPQRSPTQVGALPSARVVVAAGHTTLPFRPPVG